MFLVFWVLRKKKLHDFIFPAEVIIIIILNLIILALNLPEQNCSFPAHLKLGVVM